MAVCRQHMFYKDYPIPTSFLYHSASYATRLLGRAMFEPKKDVEMGLVV